jgi:hypothetical protein
VVATSSFACAAGETLHRRVLDLGPQLPVDKHHGVAKPGLQFRKRASAAAISSVSLLGTIGQTQ